MLKWAIRGILLGKECSRLSVCRDRFSHQDRTSGKLWESRCAAQHFQVGSNAVKHGDRC